MFKFDPFNLRQRVFGITFEDSSAASCTSQNPSLRDDENRCRSVTSPSINATNVADVQGRERSTCETEVERLRRERDDALRQKAEAVVLGKELRASQERLSQQVSDLVKDNAKLAEENRSLREKQKALCAARIRQQGQLGVCSCYFRGELNVDYKADQSQKLSCAGRSYFTPSGSVKHVLEVRGKYDDGDAWIGSTGNEGSWAIAYHGTTPENAAGIIRNGFDLSKSKTSSYGKGIYCTPDPNTAKNDYAKSYTCNGKSYRVVLEVRVNPSAVKAVRNSNQVTDEYWLVAKAESIRPSAVCIYEV